MKKKAISRYSAVIVMLLLATACSKSGKSSQEVEVPKLDKGCLSGQCVKGQFETTYQRFVLVTGNVVNLRTRPEVTSKVLTQLPVSRKVTVLYILPEETTIGGIKGKWAFIRDTVDISLQGWVFDHFLAFADSFTRPDRWKIREIRTVLGGRLIVYKCTPDGKFKVSQNEMMFKRDGNSLPEKATGEILQCKNIVWLKKDRPDDYPVFFYFMDNGKLSFPDQYKDKRGTILVR
ncbi:MAG TPA: SH3 domain-containing protein [Spirochaetota bacterium]|nr:SH3 domain-containing protein [Spirochaetota bacterium]HPV41820.1 SH3 domain-containing protein [Spirochaetota bacterium]